MAGNDTRTLKVKWVTDTTGITSGAKAAVGGIQSFAKTLSGLGGSLGQVGTNLSGVGSIAAGVFTGQALTSGVQEVIRGFVDLAKVALEDEKSQALLAQTMRSVVGASSATIASSEGFIRSVELQTGVLNTDLRPAYATLLRSTHDITGAQSLLRLALDISAGTGRDLGSVTTALAKAQGGSYTALKRLIPTIDTARAKSEGMTYVQKQLNQAFGGDAQTAANTTAGQLKILGARWHDLQEQLGSALLPALNTASSDLNTLSGIADKSGFSLGGLVKTLTTSNLKMYLPGGLVGSLILDRFRGKTKQASDATDTAAKVQDRLNEAQKTYAQDLANSSTSTDKLAKDKQAVTDASSAQKTITESLNAAIDDGTSATDSNTAATKEAAQAAKDAAQKQTDYMESITGVRQAQIDMSNTTLALNSDVVSYNKAASDAAKAGYKNRDANDAWQKAAFGVEGDILTVAQNAAKGAEEIAKMSGATFTQAQSAAAQKTALEKVRDTLAPNSPFRSYIDGLIKDLDRLSANRSGRIDYGVYVNGRQTNIVGNPAGTALRFSAGGQAVMYQHGGLVDAPPGQPVPAIVHGGEYVISREDMQAAQSGSRATSTSPLGASHSTYNITQNIAAGADPVAIGRATVDAIRAYERRNGHAWRTP